MERQLEGTSASSPCRFEALPESCLLDVLKHVDAADLRTGLRFASRQCRNITCTPALWRKKLEVDFALGEFAGYVDDRCVERMYVHLKVRFDTFRSMRDNGKNVAEHRSIYYDRKGGGQPARRGRCTYLENVPDGFFTDANDANVKVVFLGDDAAMHEPIRTVEDYRRMLTRGLCLVEALSQEKHSIARVSVACEDTVELIKHLKQAVEGVTPPEPSIRWKGEFEELTRWHKCYQWLQGLLLPRLYELLLKEGGDKQSFFGQNDAFQILQFENPPVSLKACKLSELAIINAIQVRRSEDAFHQNSHSSGAIYACMDDFSCASYHTLDVIQKSVEEGFCSVLRKHNNLDGILACAGEEIPNIETCKSECQGEWVEFCAPQEDEKRNPYVGVAKNDCFKFWPVVWYKFHGSESVSPDDVQFVDEYLTENWQINGFQQITINLEKPHIGTVAFIETWNQTHGNEPPQCHGNGSFDPRDLRIYGHTVPFNWL